MHAPRLAIPVANRMLHSMRRPRPNPGSLMAVLSLSCVALAAAGCVTSERSAYARHLEARVAPGPASDDDLAFAFGLDEYAATPLARRD